MTDLIANKGIKPGRGMTARSSMEEHVKDSGVYRQGDVLIRRIDAVPAGAKPTPRDNGRVILAHGEVTGHAHQIADPDGVGAELLTMPRTAPLTHQQVETNATFLRLTKKAQLVHEEHATIDLPPGAYEVVHQREYAYGESQRVLD